MTYHCQPIHSANINEHVTAYHHFHVRLQQLNSKTPKNFEVFNNRAIELLQLANRKECLIYSEAVVIGWLAIEIWEAANGMPFFELTGDLLHPINDASLIHNFSIVLHQWKSEFKLKHGFLKVTGQYKMHLCILLNGQLLDELQYFALKIAEANLNTLSNWLNNTTAQALHEVFSVAVPEKYLQAFVIALNAGLDDIPTAMRIFTRHTNIAAEKKNIIDRLAGGRQHLILMLLNKADEIVGATNITIFPNNKTARQWLTYVHPQHRNSNLAKYLKAKMLIKIKEEYPEVTDIATDCYKGNVAMISINRQIGFSPTTSAFDYKISL